MSRDDFDPAELDDGIRGMVLWLRDNGFRTTDSGDGSKHGNMGGALPVPHVAMVIVPSDMISECDRLHALVNDPEWQVEGTYIPGAALGVILVSYMDAAAVAASMALEAIPSETPSTCSPSG